MSTAQTARRLISEAVHEADTLTCKSCTKIVLVPGYCRHCADYWGDVANGLWEIENDI